MQGQRRQQWKPDHHAHGHDDQRQQLAARRTFFLEQPQQAQRKHAGDGGPGNGQEHRIELQHRDPRGGQRAAEDHHADQPVEPAAGEVFPRLGVQIRYAFH
ncbi:hypothetical protein FQZ97_1180820 [compost metagenome]